MSSEVNISRQYKEKIVHFNRVSLYRPDCPGASTERRAIPTGSNVTVVLPLKCTIVDECHCHWKIIAPLFHVVKARVSLIYLQLIKNIFSEKYHTLIKILETAFKATDLKIISNFRIEIIFVPKKNYHILD